MLWCRPVIPHGCSERVPRSACFQTGTRIPVPARFLSRLGETGRTRGELRGMRMVAKVLIDRGDKSPMSKDMMFFCIPQQAYMATTNCARLRKRPVGKVPAGAQPMLRACETCTMYPLVDSRKVPMVSLTQYLGGHRPDEANLNSAALKKALREAGERKVV